MPGLVNAGKREKSERGGKPKEWQREGEEETGVARKSTGKGKRRRRIESIGQGYVWMRKSVLLSGARLWEAKRLVEQGAKRKRDQGGMTKSVWWKQSEKSRADE